MSSGVHRLSVAKSGATRGISGNDDPTELARPRLEPIDTSFSFKNKAYLALKSAIVGMDVYGSRHGIRLDERSLAQQFGISRTPVREAMAQLEREGFVRSVPRRGVYVVRKSKREVIELITAWAALESMAARLITQNAGDEEIASLRRMFATFEDGKIRAHLDEYSEINIEFHQTIVQLSRNTALIRLADGLVKFDIDLRIFVQMSADFAILESGEHAAQRRDLLVAGVLRNQPCRHAFERGPGGNQLDDFALGFAHHIDAAARHRADKALALELCYGLAHRRAADAELFRKAAFVKADFVAAAIRVHADDRRFQCQIGFVFKAE